MKWINAKVALAHAIMSEEFAFFRVAACVVVIVMHHQQATWRRSNHLCKLLMTLS